MIMHTYDFRQSINKINIGINVISPRIPLGIDDRFKSNYNTSKATNPLPIIRKCENRFILHNGSNHNGGVMVSVLASSVIDRGFEPRSGQTKDYEICICCFCA